MAQERYDRELAVKWTRFTARCMLLAWAVCWMSLVCLGGRIALEHFHLGILLVSLILLVSAAVAWRWEIVGAGLLALEGLLIAPLDRLGGLKPTLPFTEREMATLSVMFRAGSKLVTNCLLFGDRFDQTGTSSEASWSNRTSNLPPSKEGGEGDCGRSGSDGCLQTKVAFGNSSAFYLPSVVPVRPG
jgi:hypothetical protein